MLTTFNGFQADLDVADFILFGAPLDMTTSHLPGTRFGPNAIREASLYVETYNIKVDFDADNFLIHDLGDIIAPNGDINSLLNTIYETSLKFLERKKRIIMLGGEHLITYGGVKAFYSHFNNKKICIVYLDGHFDLRDKLSNLKFSHGTTMRRILDFFPKDRIIQIGIKAPSKEEYEYAVSNNIKFVEWQVFLESNLDDIISKITDFLEIFDLAYLSIDLDVFDPAVLPGVGNPEPGGLNYFYVMKIIEKIGNVIEIPFFDITELNPLIESKISPITATKVIYGYLFSQLKYLK
ncbi:MAG: agmatinase [Candidatus Asgardarchaeum sp.]|nr:agmatinase [Candidatus Odinarchaeota archaeon]